MDQHTALVAIGAANRRSFRSSPTAGAARGALALGLCAAVIGLAAVQSAPAAEALAGVAQKVTGTLHADNGRYVLRLAPGTSHAALTDAVERLGGSVVAFQSAIDLVVVEAPDEVTGQLAGIGGVLGVAADEKVKAQSLGFDPNSQPGSMTKVTEITGAEEFWKQGFTGAGVDVAVLDTGIAPVPGLKDPAKVVVGPDLSFESQLDSTRFLDSYGHGTNMAGIIAGRETGQNNGWAYANDNSNFYGMAPDARLISIKLADHGGAVDVTQIIAGIDWVAANYKAHGMNIRVLNLSYGVLSRNDANSDPLAWAAMALWRTGVAVVASTGNDGDTVQGLASPAYSPWIIAVGAQDTKGTATYTDDTVPSFSERGVSGGRGPDLVAPGVGIVSLGVPGSKLYAENSGARVGNGFLRGSGTSQAAAVVSGALALMYNRAGWASPDDMKGTLLANSTRLNGVDTSAQGQGALDLRRVLNAQTGRYWYQQPATGNGNGPIENTRGGQNLTMDGVALTGERDIFGLAWSSQTMANAVANGQSWTWDGYFNNTQWTGSQYITNDWTSWAGKTWQGKTWQGKTWQGKTWQGKTWQGKTWQVGQWTGSGWSSASWGGATATPGWAGRVWSSAGWK